MKKIYLTLSIFTIIASGCNVFRQPSVLVSAALDYAEYQKAGFFISESNSVSFIYEPVASVSALQLSGYKIKGTGDRSFADDAFQTSRSQPVASTSKEYIRASRQEVLRQIVKEAKEKGANAIINLKIETITSHDKAGYLYISGYSADGMAIKK